MPSPLKNLPAQGSTTRTLGGQNLWMKTMIHFVAFCSGRIGCWPEKMAAVSHGRVNCSVCGTRGKFVQTCQAPGYNDFRRERLLYSTMPWVSLKTFQLFQKWTDISLTINRKMIQPFSGGFCTIIKTCLVVVEWFYFYCKWRLYHFHVLLIKRWVFDWYKCSPRTENINPVLERMWEKKIWPCVR